MASATEVLERNDVQWGTIGQLSRSVHDIAAAEAWYRDVLRLPHLYTFGNLAFFDQYDGRFRLAPIYDMLPMLYAPEHDQLAARNFAPPDPSSANLREYGRARGLAEQFWRSCAQDERISEAFRRICAGCLASLEALPRTGAYVAV